MKYNKTSTKRRLQRADSKKSKVQHKVLLTVLKSIMVFVIIIVC